MNINVVEITYIFEENSEWKFEVEVSRLSLLIIDHSNQPPSITDFNNHEQQVLDSFPRVS